MLRHFPHLARNDVAQTNEDTPITINLLSNDLGGSAKHLVSIAQRGPWVLATGPTDLGAIITMHDDGTITYDPTQSDEIQALNSGQTLDDTFGYTMQAGHGKTSTASVTVHLMGEDDTLEKVLDGVPAYNWYHGCGPTASASVIGYYDLHRYSQLFDAEAGMTFDRPRMFKIRFPAPRIMPNMTRRRTIRPLLFRLQLVWPISCIPPKTRSGMDGPTSQI